MCMDLFLSHCALSILSILMTVEAEESKKTKVDPVFWYNLYIAIIQYPSMGIYLNIEDIAVSGNFKIFVTKPKLYLYLFL